MLKLRFPGETFEIDLATVVNQSEPLRRYRDQLAELQLRDEPVGRTAAQLFVERFVRTAMTSGAYAFERGCAPHIDAIMRLSDEIARRYNVAITRFARGAPAPSGIPSDLDPAALNRLFEQLDRQMEALDRYASAKEAGDMHAHVEKSFSIHELAEAEAHAGGDLPPEGPKPDLPLDPPRGAGERPPRGEGDAAYRAHHAEVRRHARPTRARREEVRRSGFDMVARGQLPPGTVVTPVWARAWSQGLEAQLERFVELDPTFLGRGFELKIKLPSGTTFQPDGIRFLPPDGRRYLLLESKEPYTWTEHNYYNTPQGRTKLTDMLHEHRGIADGLRSRGCAGFRYETGHPGLDAFIAEAIAEMRGEDLDGADLLSAPGID